MGGVGFFCCFSWFLLVLLACLSCSFGGVFLLVVRGWFSFLFGVINTFSLSGLRYLQGLQNLSSNVDALQRFALIQEAGHGITLAFPHFCGMYVDLVFG